MPERADWLVWLDLELEANASTNCSTSFADADKTDGVLENNFFMLGLFGENSSTNWLKGLFVSPSNVRVYTREGNGAFIPTQGSKVFVGDTELLNVCGLELNANMGGVWELTLKISVDPLKLFLSLPAVGSPEDK